MPPLLKQALTESDWDLRRQSLGSASREGIPLGFVDAVASDPYEGNRLWAADQLILRWSQIDPAVAVLEASRRLENPGILWTQRRDPRLPLERGFSAVHSAFNAQGTTLRALQRGFTDSRFPPFGVFRGRLESELLGAGFVGAVDLRNRGIEDVFSLLDAKLSLPGRSSRPVFESPMQQPFGNGLTAMVTYASGICLLVQALTKPALPCHGHPIALDLEKLRRDNYRTEGVTSEAAATVLQNLRMEAIKRFDTCFGILNSVSTVLSALVPFCQSDPQAEMVIAVRDDLDLRMGPSD